jgi:hypothetical protein
VQLAFQVEASNRLREIEDFRVVGDHGDSNVAGSATTRTERWAILEVVQAFTPAVSRLT